MGFLVVVDWVFFYFLLVLLVVLCQVFVYVLYYRRVAVILTSGLVDLVIYHDAELLLIAKVHVLLYEHIFRIYLRIQPIVLGCIDHIGDLNETLRQIIVVDPDFSYLVQVISGLVQVPMGLAYRFADNCQEFG